MLNRIDQKYAIISKRFLGKFGIGVIGLEGCEDRIPHTFRGNRRAGLSVLNVDITIGTTKQRPIPKNIQDEILRIVAPQHVYFPNRTRSGFAKKYTN